MGTVNEETITIPNLEAGSLYSIQAAENKSSRSLSDTPQKTSVGTILFTVEEDGDVSFSINEMGLKIGDSYHISKLEGNDDWKIDESEDQYILYNKDGRFGKLYEEFYVISQEELEKQELDPSNIAINIFTTGSGTKDNDYGLILGSNFQLSQDPKNYAVLDLNSYDQIGIYNSLFIEKTNKPSTQEIKLQNPVMLKIGEENQITDKNIIFRINTASLDHNTEYVLRINTAEGIERERYTVTSNNANPRYAESGLRRPYMFPLNNDDDQILIYIGKIDAEEKDFIFNFNINTPASFPDYGTVEIMSLPEDIKAPEKITINNNELITSFEVDKGKSTIIPFLIEEDDNQGFDIYFQCTDKDCSLSEDEIRMIVVAGLDKGFGYATTPAGPKENAGVWASDIVEYIYFEINSPGQDHRIEVYRK